LPRWTGIALTAGVVLVSLSQTLPEGPQVVAAAIRGLGFAGMGAALLGAERRSPQVPTEGPVSGIMPGAIAETPALAPE
jgi:hypothetical protein